MKRIPYIIILCLLTSCTAREVKLSADADKDSLAFKVAVMPTMDCLPVYYAERMGMYDSLGVDVRIMSFLSQMDIDTALAAGNIHLAHSSLTRLEIMRRKGADSIDVVAEIPERLFLLTARNQRIKNLQQLKGRMVGIDRFSNADYWSDIIMEQAGLEQTDIYRPQFNDVQLRTSMLTTQLIDAAFLPEPYATEARMKGHTQIFETPDSVPGFNCFSAPRQTVADTLRAKQQAMFLKAYALAVKELNKQPNIDTLQSILITRYNLTNDIIDTLQLPKFKNITEPSDSTKLQATNWIEERLSTK